jgi:hypothetical protein
MARTSVFTPLFALVIACGGSSGGTDVPCSGDETRCDGDQFQTCNGETFEVAETCAGATVCDPTVGCASCTPAGGTTCDGDDVRVCGGDGNPGDVVETCDPGGCSGGSCGGGFGCDAAGAELIYLVDVDNTFLSFDPESLGTAADPFEVIGTLSCPAGQSLRRPAPATPFSMSVDRDAMAWVLYDSGEIFHVSTEDASCAATSFQVGQSGFQLFGMGFVTDTPGGDAETLFVTGGSAATTTPGDLGSIDTASLTLTPIGDLPNAENGPELTGTGDAKLFGYYPGSSDTFVAEVDKGSGASAQTYPLDPLGGNVQAWAFAHYGGKFYIFVTTVTLGGSTSRVIEFDPAGPSEDIVIPNSPHTIVGAGVSTCAPVVVD